MISLLSLHCYLRFIYIYYLLIYLCNLFAADVLTKTVEMSANIAAPLAHGTLPTESCASGLKKVCDCMQQGMPVGFRHVLAIYFVSPISKKKKKKIK